MTVINFSKSKWYRKKYSEITKQNNIAEKQFFFFAEKQMISRKLKFNIKIDQITPKKLTKQ